MDQENWECRQRWREEEEDVTRVKRGGIKVKDKGGREKGREKESREKNRRGQVKRQRNGAKGQEKNRCKCERKRQDGGGADEELQGQNTGKETAQRWREEEEEKSKTT